MRVASMYATPRPLTVRATSTCGRAADGGGSSANACQKRGHVVPVDLPGIPAEGAEPVADRLDGITSSVPPSSPMPLRSTIAQTLPSPKCDAAPRRLPDLPLVQLLVAEQHPDPDLVEPAQARAPPPSRSRSRGRGRASRTRSRCRGRAHVRVVAERVAEARVAVEDLRRRGSRAPRAAGRRRRRSGPSTGSAGRGRERPDRRAGASRPSTARRGSPRPRRRWCSARCLAIPISRIVSRRIKRARRTTAEGSMPLAGSGAKLAPSVAAVGPLDAPTISRIGSNPRSIGSNGGESVRGGRHGFRHRCARSDRRRQRLDPMSSPGPLRTSRVDVVTAELRQAILDGRLAPGGADQPGGARGGVRHQPRARPGGVPAARERGPDHARPAQRRLGGEAGVGRVHRGVPDPRVARAAGASPPACPTSPTTQVAELGAFVDAMEAVPESVEWLDLDRRFHLLSYAGAPLPRLLRMIEGFWNDDAAVPPCALRVPRRLGRPRAGACRAPPAPERDPAQGRGGCRGAAAHAHPPHAERSRPLAGAVRPVSTAGRMGAPDADVAHLVEADAANVWHPFTRHKSYDASRMIVGRRRLLGDGRRRPAHARRLRGPVEHQPRLRQPRRRATRSPRSSHVLPASSLFGQGHPLAARARGAARALRARRPRRGSSSRCRARRRSTPR